MVLVVPGAVAKAALVRVGGPDIFHGVVPVQPTCMIDGPRYVKGQECVTDVLCVCMVVWLCRVVCVCAFCVLRSVMRACAHVTVRVCDVSCLSPWRRQKSMMHALSIWSLMPFSAWKRLMNSEIP